MGTVTETLKTKLETAFNPVQMDVIDDSEKHRGHGGYREGGESHFRVVIVSEAFTGQSRLARQRAVNEVLAEELAGPVHALSVKALSPDEA